MNHWRLSRGPRTVPSGIAVLLLLCLACNACTQRSGDYYPFIPGAYWRYDVKVKTVQLIKRSKSTVVGLEPVQLEGREVLRNKINADTLYYYDRLNGEIVRIARQAAESSEPEFEAQPIIVLPLHPEPGASWTVNSRTGVLETTVDPFRRLYRIEEPIELHFKVVSLDADVRVPAGHFSGCLEVEGVGTTMFPGDKTIFAAEINVRQTDWYAPGVGLVKSHRVETTTSKVLPRGEFLMELEVVEL